MLTGEKKSNLETKKNDNNERQWMEEHAQRVKKENTKIWG